MPTLPIIYTPFTKLQAGWGTRQGSTCGEFEMDFVRCASRVGMNKAKFECLKEIEDFHECLWRSKQTQRTDIMEAERKRQKRPYIEPLGKDIPGKEY
ncbi:NADH dehydrogenase [ubiquinone] iron-sulfur protein 5 [Aplysia californica]|uniref:NADH dehydrogenase [ubiquinone] iron-sulfur protein 5 n=1 Tax=Aplysia californica TaxID=6500 RepID=A0ABM0JND7_APLCA|nr:NADH dehydrogenase [ubiquinone] iron-sulfur protein 5 [Aplysia californica]